MSLAPAFYPLLYRVDPPFGTTLFMIAGGLGKSSNAPTCPRPLRRMVS